MTRLGNGFQFGLNAVRPRGQRCRTLEDAPLLNRQYRPRLRGGIVVDAGEIRHAHHLGALCKLRS